MQQTNETSKSSGRRVYAITALLAVASVVTWYVYIQRPANVRELREKAAEAFAVGDWEAAAAAAERWTAAAPADAEAWIRYANALGRLGRHEDAYQATLQVNEQYLYYSDILELRANILIRELHKPLECLRVCEQLIHREPASPAAHHFRIFIEAMLRRTAGLETALRSAVENGAETPADYGYFMMLDAPLLLNSAEITEQWAAACPDDESVTAAFAANEVAVNQLLALKPGSSVDPSGALQRRDIFLQRCPNNPVLAASAMQSAIDNGDIDRLRSLLQLPALQHLDPAVRMWFEAWLDLQTGDADAAAETAQQILRTRPLSYRTWALLADAHRSLGSTEAAEEAGTIAAFGARVSEDIRGLSSLEAVTPEHLRRIQSFASSVSDFSLEAALTRRLGTTIDRNLPNRPE